MTHTPLVQIGQEVLPGYHLCRRRGAGAFGEVWEAVTPDDRSIALKLLPSNAARATSQEIRSLQTVRRLQHPNLIAIEQVWCQSGYIIIAMELADGSLADLLDVYQAEYGMPIPPAHACSLLTQAARGLDFLNTRQHLVNGMRMAVSHCDVKPSNLLLFGDTVKVADFSLSAWSGSALRESRRAGTLDYCAPEVFRGQLSTHTDQYALAVSYCVLRGGRLPFRDTPATFHSEYVRPAPDLTMLPAPERPLVARALHAVPQDRWPSCAILMEQLSLVAK